MIIVASVSCIGLGAVDYGATVLKLRTGGSTRRGGLQHLVDLQYQRNDQALEPGFRVRGDTLELQPAGEFVIRVEFFGDEVERITGLDPLTGELLADRKEGERLPGDPLRRRPTSSRRTSSTSKPRWRSGSASSRPGRALEGRLERR